MHLIKNWTFHNLVSHPLSEIVYLVIRPFSRELAEQWSGSVHDLSILDDHDNGRG